PTAGSNVATGSAEDRMMTKPIKALQKPATIQGSVNANNTSATMSKKLNPPGDNANAARHKDPAMVTANRSANTARLANMVFPAASVSFMSEQVQLAGQVTASHPAPGGADCSYITHRTTGNSSREQGNVC